MTDIVNKKTRSRMMSGIRATDTKPEIAIRKGLFSRGFRYRLHVKELPGKPDLVLPKYQAVIFVHGCFWHGHQCSLFKWPGSNSGFWKKKITGNRERDRKRISQLQSAGWRILTIWECSFRGKHQLGLEEVIERAEHWLKSDSESETIREEP
jgi:DNA mismatch endonuclease (patch repair protein)